MRYSHCFTLVAMMALISAGTAGAVDNQGSASPPTDPLVLTGDGELISCSDPTMAKKNILALVDKAADDLDILEYEASIQKLDEVLAALPCTSTMISRELLVRIYFLRGLAAFYSEEENETAAQEHFRRALTIDSTLPWDTDYPQDPELVFGRAREEVLRVELTTLEFNLNGVVDNAFINGATMDRRGLLELMPGTHLLQYTVGEEYYSRLLVLGSDGASLGRPTGNGGSEPTKRSPGSLTLGVAGLTYGLGTAYYNAGLSLQVRLFKGLELTFGGHANLGVSEADDGSRWGSLLPDAFVGARVQFGQQAFRPYVGATLLLAFWNNPDPTVSAGPILLAGFNLKLGPRVDLTVNANVGYLNGLWTGLNAGPSFNF